MLPLRIEEFSTISFRVRFQKKVGKRFERVKMTVRLCDICVTVFPFKKNHFELSSETDRDLSPMFLKSEVTPTFLIVWVVQRDKNPYPH